MLKNISEKHILISVKFGVRRTIRLANCLDTKWSGWIRLQGHLKREDLFPNVLGISQGIVIKTRNLTSNSFNFIEKVKSQKNNQKNIAGLINPISNNESNID